VRHRSRLITSPQLTRHTRRPSTEPCNSLRWPWNEFSSTDDVAGCGAVATDERTSSTVSVSLRARTLTTNYIDGRQTRMGRHSADRRSSNVKRSRNFGRADQVRRSALLVPCEVRLLCG
jgi:hypothetical protein